MDLAAIFREELTDGLDQLELILANLEKERPDQSLRDQAQRIIHNLKISAQVAGLEACSRVMHRLETLVVEKNRPDLVQSLRKGMDLSLRLTLPGTDPRDADRFLAEPLPLVQDKAADPALRILVCGESSSLRPHQAFFQDHLLALTWTEDAHDLAIILHEAAFDAVILDAPSFSLAQGGLIRRIRRVSETMPIVVLTDTATPCFLLQVSRLEQISCFLRPHLRPESLMLHLQNRIIKSRQATMFRRALHSIWYLDGDARVLMHYQDALRKASGSHQDWDFENHSHEDKRLILSDVHDEIDRVLSDLMQRIDQKTLPLSLVRMRHRHLLDCICQHFFEEQAIMRSPGPSKKFLDQHIRHHEEAMQDFHSQGSRIGMDAIRFFCDRVLHFTEQHESFDQTLEEYLLRGVA